MPKHYIEVQKNTIEALKAIIEFKQDDSKSWNDHFKVSEAGIKYLEDKLDKLIAKKGNNDDRNYYKQALLSLQNNLQILRRLTIKRRRYLPSPVKSVIKKCILVLDMAFIHICNPTNVSKGVDKTFNAIVYNAIDADHNRKSTIEGLEKLSAEHKAFLEEVFDPIQVIDILTKVKEALGDDLFNKLEGKIKDKEITFGKLIEIDESKPEISSKYLEMIIQKLRAKEINTIYEEETHNGKKCYRIYCPTVIAKPAEQTPLIAEPVSDKSFNCFYQLFNRSKRPKDEEHIENVATNRNV